MGKRWFRLMLALINVLSLAPLAWLLLDAAFGRLGPNPIQVVQLRTGSYALFILASSLACTPLYTLTGMARFPDLRRTLGLYAFLYASLHFLNLIGLDYQFNFRALWLDVGTKRYIVAGMPAFVILLALAVTSTAGWKKRLGRNWKRLHRLVYLAAILAVIHYFWQVKVRVPGPLIYGAVLVLLLLVRLPWLERIAAKRLPWRTI